MPGSFLLQTGFVVTSLTVLGLLTLLIDRVASRRAAVGFALVAGGWAAFTFGLARAGWLAHFDLPPRPLPLFILGAAAVTALIFSRVGAKLATASWWWLIGLQVFRLPVELLIHRAVVEGVAPPQISWDGYNLDILTALTAVPVAWLASRGELSRRGLLGWNVAGAGLLGTVVVVATLSMPTPFQQLKPDNTWIAFSPYIWLPTVLVMTAGLLHGLSIRRLWSSRPG